MSNPYWRHPASHWGGCFPQPRSSLAVTILVFACLAHHLHALSQHPVAPAAGCIPSARSIHVHNVTTSPDGSIYHRFFQIKISVTFKINHMINKHNAVKSQDFFSLFQPWKWKISYNNVGDFDEVREKSEKEQGTLWFPAFSR
ncbi:hypothetical protein [Aeromonas sanarellii]|uniref:hypothetical protein n=1 Tax=Aeromonas sanarellii TaxID=633415 RepID=UPI0038D25333